MGYGFVGDGFNCCRWVEIDGIWLIWSLIFGFVQWSRWVAFWVDFGGGLARDGLRGGSRWVWVARSGGSHFWWIPMVLGVGFLLLFCFTLLQTHSVEYFPEHFPRMQTNTEKKNLFSLKSFAFENILQCKMFYIETNGA
jgi:hypothetical protein